jgi:hypothetical protein
MHNTIDKNYVHNSDVPIPKFLPMPILIFLPMPILYYLEYSLAYHIWKNTIFTDSTKELSWSFIIIEIQILNVTIAFQNSKYCYIKIYNKHIAASS